MGTNGKFVVIDGNELSFDDGRTVAGLQGVAERHGGDALAFVSSSRCTGEENHLVQKMARAAFRGNRHL